MPIEASVLPRAARHDMTIRGELHWEFETAHFSQVSRKNWEFIDTLGTNEPDVGYKKSKKISAAQRIHSCRPI